MRRWFDGKLDMWETKPLREVDRVADHIVKMLLARLPKAPAPEQSVEET